MRCVRAESGARGARLVQDGRCKATWTREFKLPCREAGPPNHLDDKVDSDQQVVNPRTVSLLASLLLSLHEGSGSHALAARGFENLLVNGISTPR